MYCKCVFVLNMIINNFNSCSALYDYKRPREDEGTNFILSRKIGKKEYVNKAVISRLQCIRGN